MLTPNNSCKALQIKFISSDMFDKLVNVLSQNEALETVSFKDFKGLIHGFKEKYMKAAYCAQMDGLDGKYGLIVNGMTLNFLYDNTEQFIEWKQYVIRPDNSGKLAENEVNAAIDGRRAIAIVMKKVNEYYTKDEIDSIFSQHEREYDPYKAQLHVNDFYDYILELEDCYELDINAAYTDALCELFPRCKKDFLVWYEKRHETTNNIRNYYKQVFNLSTGFFAHNSKSNKWFRPKTYHWIVQRVRKQIDEAIEYCEGSLVYANTDGFIIQSPKNIINNSAEIGKFKLEYQGKVYIYRSAETTSTNYWLVQLDDKDKTKKGNLPNVLKPMVDLSKGKLIRFKKYRRDDGSFSYKDISTTHEEVINEKEESEKFEF